MTEVAISHEEEVRKEEWLDRLANFIVIANGKTWAADSPKIDPQKPGFKELQWPYPSMTKEDLKAYEGWEDWVLRDSYSGYFRAPGMTTVYYKGVPSWTMSYGGHGQTEEYYGITKPTFNFLKEALKKVTPQLPFRGPKEYVEGDKRYEFEMLEGDIEDGLWRERITESGMITFRQTGVAGLVINKDSNRNPIYPWNL